MAGFWRVYPPQSQHNARNVGSDRMLSERCLTNVDSDPRSLPAPGLWRPSSASPPPRGGHPASLPVGTPGNGWDSSRLELSTGRTVPCARALLHKARAAEGRRAAASWRSSSVSNRPALPVPCVPGWDRSVGRGGTHRRRVRDTTAQQPAAQTTGGGV